MTTVQLNAEASTATPATPDQRDEFAGNAPWIAEFHRNELIKADAQAGHLATLRLTDERHLTLDKAHAQALDSDYADRVLSTAIFYLGAAVKASADPAQALRALHAALGMTTEEG